MNQRLAALEFITGCLSLRRGPDIDDILHSTIVSKCLDWQTILEITNTQKIAPALWVALRNRKLVEYLPAEARERLFKTYLLNILKNKGFREQAIEAVRQLNAIGVEPILIKGGASLFVKTFDDPGSRVMVDLDILVPKRSAEDCQNALRTLGYLPVADKPHYHIDFSRHHHLRGLYRPDEYGRIEIHKDALPANAARILPAQLIWEQAEPVVNQFGIAISVPSPTHRVLHNLLHSDLINQTYSKGKISLRSLHELVMMQTLYRERLDWETIQQLMDRGGQAQVLRASLFLAHRLFGSPMPDRMCPTPRAVAHYARTRLQVRWDWINELVDRAYWFSTESICERYKCDKNFWSVAKGRTKLAVFLSGKYSRQAFHFIVRQICRGSARMLTSV